jgi:hypothetical protein
LAPLFALVAFAPIRSTLEEDTPRACEHTARLP